MNFKNIECKFHFPVWFRYMLLLKPYIPKLKVLNSKFLFLIIIENNSPNGSGKYHVHAMLQRRWNNRFHVASTWNTRGVFAGKLNNQRGHVIHKLNSEHA